MAEIDVVVVKTPKGYLVRPAYVLAGPDDVITWHNLTGKNPGSPVAGEEIAVSIPCGALAAPACSVDLKKAVLRIPHEPPYGFHAYSVYSKRKGGYCKGESTPGIIIKG